MKLNKTGPKNHLYDQLIADGEIRRVPISEVDRDENQPRSIEEVKTAAKQLMPSVKSNGIVQLPVYQEKPDGRYMIIVGECRTAAAKNLGHGEIAAVIKTFDDDEQAKKKIAEIRYAENDPTTRKSLTPLDEAKFWADYIDQFYTENGVPQVKAAADRLGQNASRISQFLGVHKASDKIKALIKKHKIVDFQLAYIMARMEKYPGLVEEFIEKITSADMIGGTQTLANKMLKEAAGKERTDRIQKTTLDMPGQEEATKPPVEPKKPESGEPTQSQQQADTTAPQTDLAGDSTQGQGEQQKTEPASQYEPATTKTDAPASIGSVCLKMNPNTVILSTIANQPATLNEEHVKGLIANLTKWLEK